MNTAYNLSKTPKFFILCSLLVIAAFTLVNCGDIEEDPDPESGISGYATDVVSHTHTKGTDPCPQDISNKIEVFCYEADEYNGCDADSVAITIPSTGLTALFSNGQTSMTLPDEDGSTKISLKFTCVIAESFTHTYTLVFYKDGVEVATEDVDVVVTVN